MKPTVLIIDDDPAFRQVVGVLLAARGFPVVGEAQGAIDGIALAAERNPEAVLLDVELPDGDGLAVAADLSREGGPRVVLTSCDPAAAPERLVRRSRAAGFVAKEDLAGPALEAYLMS